MPPSIFLSEITHMWKCTRSNDHLQGDGHFLTLLTPHVDPKVAQNQLKIKICKEWVLPSYLPYEITYEQIYSFVSSFVGDGHTFTLFYPLYDHYGYLCSTGSNLAKNSNHHTKLSIHVIHNFVSIIQVADLWLISNVVDWRLIKLFQVTF